MPNAAYSICGRGPKDLPVLHADEEELRRALVNLIRNAVQAMDGWGVIVLRAEQEGGMVHVKTSDTGSVSPRRNT